MYSSWYCTYILFLCHVLMHVYDVHEDLVVLLLPEDLQPLHQAERDVVAHVQHRLDAQGQTLFSIACALTHCNILQKILVRVSHPSSSCA